MNYLQLVQDVLLILRAGNDKLSSPPTDVVGLDGVQYEIARWVAMSVLDIQNWKAGWLFMRRRAEISVPAGGRVVSVRGSIPDLNFVIPSTGDNDAPFITTFANPGDAEIKCYYIPYEAWRGSVYDREPRSQSSAPIRFTIRPDQSLEFDPEPSSAIIARFDYQCAPEPIGNDKDAVPIIPVQYHRAIVWWAVVNYYCTTRDGANYLLRTGQAQLTRELTRLRNDQLPAVTYGGFAR